MAHQPYPAKRYHASGDTKYINGPDEESSEWFDSPKKAAAAAAKKPAKPAKE
jgi:hypothetical protein